MVPELFRIPGLGIPVNTYGFLIMVGFLVGVAVGVRNGRREGIDKDFLIDFAIYLMVMGFLGAKVVYMLQVPGQYERPWEVFDLRDGRVSAPGALLAVLPVVAFWGYRHESELLRRKLWAGFGLLLAATVVAGVVTWKASPEVRWGRASWLIVLGAAVLGVLLGLAAASGSRGRAWRPLSLRGGVLAAAVVAAGVVGVRAAALAGRPQDYSWDFFTKWQTGFVLYGGLVVGGVAGVAYLLWHDQPVRKVLDVVAGPMVLAIAFGRVGCFLNGCCWGRVAKGLICAVPYPKETGPWKQQVAERLIVEGAPFSLPVHPTQLYESLVMVAVFFAVQAVARRKRWDGQAFAVAACGYAIWRFLVEFLRGDPRPAWQGLSFSQWVSVAVVVVVAVAWCAAYWAGTGRKSSGRAT